MSYKKEIPSNSNLITQNTTRLLNLFIEKDFLSISDIQNTLHFKTRQTVYNYINRLQDMGCSFSKTIQNRCTYYHLDNKNSEKVQLLLYKPLTLNTLRKYSILKDLQEKPISNKSKLHTATPDIKKSQFYELFNELLEEKEIYRADNKNFYLTGKTFTPSIRVNFDQIDSLYCQLRNLPSNTSHYAQYQSLREKISICFEASDSSSDVENYICYGHFPHALNKKTLSVLHQLQEADFPHNVLTITYFSRKGISYTKNLAIGIIVHVLEKDQMYLIGKELRNKITNTIIPVENITYIEKTEMKNDYYHSEEFEKLFCSMFSISTKSPVNVKVAFDNWGNIKNKITALCKQRTTATQQTVGQQIIYTDCISGLDDFAKYLRQFGKAVHVLEPQELHDKLKDSFSKTLENYERYNND